jgi:hypothetical protein
MIYVFAVFVMALAYCAKGGWLDAFPKYKELVEFYRLKRVLPLLIVLIPLLFIVSPLQAVLFTLAWAYCYSSMGEEAGAVGDYQGGWGDYMTGGFGRSYGIMKALQYGLSWGALLTLITGCVWFVPAGATFPVCYFIGSSIAALRGQKGWAYAEPIYGAVIGIAMGVWLDGL